MADRVARRRQPTELRAQLVSNGPTFPLVAIDDEVLAIDGTAVPAGRWVSMTFQHGNASITLRAMAGATDDGQNRQLFAVLTDEDRELLDVVRALASLAAEDLGGLSNAKVLPWWIPVRAFAPPPLR